MDLEKLYRRAPAPLQTVFLNAFALKVSLHRYGPRYRSLLSDFLAHDEWTRGQLEAFQSARIRLIVQHAFDHSAHYRDVMMSEGLSPSSIRTPADLKNLPLLTKDMLRSDLPRILTAPKPKPGWLHGHTSGTTGSPLSLWYDRDMAVVNNVVDARQKRWAGMSSKDWLGLILGRVVVSPDRKRPPFWKTNYVHRQVWFSSFHLQDDTVDAYAQEIRRRKLRYLEGYPSTLYILAQHLNSSGDRIPLKAVFTSSETLHEVQRDAIEKAFECEIFDFFGHAERVIFAAECEAHDGKHLAEDYGFTEVVDIAGHPVDAGEIGYLVGTSLHNVAMPMIRYRTNDLSRIIEEPCTCGRVSRRIADVSTKAEDIIVTPEGRFLSPSILTHPFKPFVAIRKSQITQESRNRIVVRLMVSDSWSESQEIRLRNALSERLGENVEIRILVVDDLPREASGKFRWVVSEVDHPNRFSWTGTNREGS